MYGKQNNQVYDYTYKELAVCNLHLWQTCTSSELIETVNTDSYIQNGRIVHVYVLQK